MLYGGRPEKGRARKSSASSHAEYHRRSTGVGVYDEANSRMGYPRAAYSAHIPHCMQTYAAQRTHTRKNDVPVPNREPAHQEVAP